MDATVKRLAFTLGMFAAIASVSGLLNSCAQTQLQQTQAQPLPKQIKIDGSSTVFPITNAIAQGFNKTKKNEAEITVDFSGTGGGFEKFCAGQTDINNASRPIQLKEMEACKQAGVPYIELPVAFDALTVVVSPKNDWAKDITLAELKKIWEPSAEGKITRWNQIRANWPNQPLKLYGPGKDSGTFDYFTEAIVSQSRASRNDYVASEDDEVLVEGVSKDSNALGYFGLGYYEANPGTLKALAVDGGKGPILPSQQTVERAEYQPLARPLFLYINANAVQKKPFLREFVEFYLEKAPELVSSVGYVPLPDEGYHLTKVHFYRTKVGTVFDGKSQFNLTIGELMRKQAKF